MSFFENQDDRFYKWSVRFVRMLMLFTLFATFEHCYDTLSQFSAEHRVWGVNVSRWAKALFVITIDFGLYLGEWFIPQFKIRRINTLLVQSMVIIFASISIFLNVKYMLQYKPSPDLINYIIAWSIGFLIPVVLGILGFIEGRILMYRYKQEIEEREMEETDYLPTVRDRKKPVVSEKTKQQVIALADDDKTEQEIASKVGISEGTVARIIAENNSLLRNMRDRYV